MPLPFPPEPAGAITAVVLVGVESTGKTTLARALAAETGWPLVPEVARAWLAARGNRYQEADLEALARLQVQAEEDAVQATGTPIIADTDLLVIRVWSEVRYGRCAPWILERLAQRSAAAYLLPRPDLPWVADPQRETPDVDARRALHARYRHLLAAGPHPWCEIAGEGAARLASAREAVRGWLPDA